MTCICYKCKKEFESSDESDIEGDGFCSECKSAKMIIARQVDAEMKELWKNRRNVPKEDIKGLYYDNGLIK